MLDSKLLASKFKGCLLGALLGDCLGAPYEGEVLGAGAKIVLQKYFDKLEGPYFKSPVKQYTDDTAMTKCIAHSLISQKTLNQRDLAQRFVKEYYAEPRRGYGKAVVDVFHKLRISNFEDPVAPAKNQFSGFGSYGNGAAMRVAPISLFFSKNFDQLVEMAKKSAEITHTHRYGMDGAVVQAVAIFQCLETSSSTMDVKDFIVKLIEKVSAVESKSDEMLGLPEPPTYVKQLNYVSEMLEKDEVPQETVIQKLGNDVAALYSVPTAIYCFLRSQKPIKDIQSDNVFRRALQYAISLGGDTDTIASMTGALAGAHLGHEVISPNLIKHCEYSEEIIKLADELLVSSR
ncbi:poly(ADP-ribose) glycohydrolase ARH3-like [Ctenocephalides felis]|uniref:poly(ADP-ribose) glycohydrolase ARH3-like n=1 Tax=Ctenocephalides felis TaxID=7515 RepID=UPI000E6E4EDF|nr:poly(ADP-ribose) glycohydrolase ARH3-like [Ctenocephalides felis]